MSNPRFLNEYKGKKLNRKDEKTQNSIIVTNDGMEFELLPGKTRKDQVGTLLGTGTKGRVKIAKDKDNKEYAVKIVDLNEPNNKFDTELFFLSSLKILTKLKRSPKLVIVNHKIYLFQELIKGEPLVTSERLNPLGYLPSLIKRINENNENDSLNFQIQLIECTISLITAINELHQQGIIHMDANPSNVLFDKNTNIAYLVDFDHSVLIDDYEKTQGIKRCLKRQANDFNHALSQHLNFDISKKHIAEFATTIKSVQALFSSYNPELSLTQTVDSALKLLSDMLNKLKKIDEYKPVSKRF